MALVPGSKPWLEHGEPKTVVGGSIGHQGDTVTSEVVSNIFASPALVVPLPVAQTLTDIPLPEVSPSVDPEVALEQQRKVHKEMRKRALKKLLLEFVRAAWCIVEPSKGYVENWHIQVLCRELQRVSDGEVKRLLVNVPPGTMKSLLISVFWPAWEWTRNPELRFLTASYSTHLTIRDNLKMRDIVESDWYKDLFDIHLDPDQNSKMQFKNTQGGWRVASSVGGAATGEHPDRIIIDDPLTADQSRSEAERLSVRNWFDGTISTRGQTRGAAIVVVMQRLHEDDLAGHLIARGGWEHVCFPMRYELVRENEPGFKPDPRDHRTEVGELLWPGLFTEAIVRQLELDLGPYGTAGQLQQRPAPEGGGLFKREWFEIVDAVPSLARRARGWDTAGTEGGGDWTVGLRIAESKGIFYVEDVVRLQTGPSGVDLIMKQTTMLDGKGISQREEKEGGSAGKTVIAARAKLLVGYDYAGVQVTGDKVTRSKPLRAQVEAGNVKLMNADWNEEFLREISVFPAGKHDDQVDAASCAFNAVLLEYAPVEVTGGVTMMPRLSPWNIGQGGGDSGDNPALMFAPGE